MLASTLVIGSGPECPHERFCLPGLQRTYGLAFKEFRSLDPGGPMTATALRRGEIDVGVLFTTDGLLTTGEFVVLEDDRDLQPAENVTPVLRGQLIDEYGAQLVASLDSVSAALTTDGLADLNAEVGFGASRAHAVRRWLEQHRLPSRSPTAADTNKVIVVGSANFSESQTVAELYTQALGDTGYRIEQAPAVGDRATYIPRMEDGELSLVPEYLGSLLAYLEPESTESPDIEVSYRALQDSLRAKGLTALRPSPAEAKNGVVVTAATAEKHGLRQVSDLARSI